jgi:hypothetical protein|tara:strand:- start:224 stop:409 length:186 start_codon:yes stop_codon:yes gene_type:complete
MIIFTVIGIIAAFFFFMIILITIVEGRFKNKQNEKLLWKMDKVETRTGGLEHDRINDREKK